MATKRGVKAEVKKEGAKGFVRADWEKLADSVNNVLGLEDDHFIEIDGMTDEELIQAIKEEAAGNVYEIDFIPDPKDTTIPFYEESAKLMFAKIEVDIIPGAPPVAGEEKEEATTDTSASIDEEEKEEKEEEKGEEKDDAEVPEPEKGESKPKKTKETKASKEVKETKETKPAEKSKKTESKPEPKAKEKDKDKPKKETKPEGKVLAPRSAKSRNKALVQILLETTKKPMTRGEIVNKSNDLYVTWGGASQLSVAEVMFRYSVPVLLDLGVVVFDDGKYSFIP